MLSFGSGDCGQLAHGVDDDDQMIVKRPRVVYSLREKKIATVACGGLHNVAATADGAVFTWGCNDDGSLGRGGEENLPARVEGGGLRGEQVVLVAAGDGQTLVATREGAVFGWGCYKDKDGKKFFDLPPGEAEPKRAKRQQDEPLRLGGVADVVELRCGSAFNVARTRGGGVLTWGIGEVCGARSRVCS